MGARRPRYSVTNFSAAAPRSITSSSTAARLSPPPGRLGPPARIAPPAVARAPASSPPGTTTPRTCPWCLAIQWPPRQRKTNVVLHGRIEAQRGPARQVQPCRAKRSKEVKEDILYDVYVCHGEGGVAGSWLARTCHARWRSAGSVAHGWRTWLDVSMLLLYPTPPDRVVLDIEAWARAAEDEDVLGRAVKLVEVKYVLAGSVEDWPGALGIAVETQRRSCPRRSTLTSRTSWVTTFQVLIPKLDGESRWSRACRQDG